MGMIIVSANNKGGVGKTTLVKNLAHAVANLGYSVCVLDLDPQCNATEPFVTTHDQMDTLYEYFEGVLKAEPLLDVTRLAYATTYENLWCIPNVEETAALEVGLARLATRPNPLNIMREDFRGFLSDRFDFTFVDTPPNWGYFVFLALHMADCVITPVLCGSKTSLDGLVRVFDLIKDVQASANPDLRFLRVVVNNLDRRNALSKQFLLQLEQAFGKETILQAAVRTNVAFQSSEAAAETIIRHNPSSTGAKNFRLLAKEFLSIMGARTKAVA